MTLYTIPCNPGANSAWFQRTTLGGSDFLLAFTWSTRDGHWYLDLADQDGNVLLAGRKLVANWWLFGSAADSRLPAGDLVLVDTTGAGEDPDFAGLGSRWALCWVTP